MSASEVVLRRLAKHHAQSGVDGFPYAYTITLITSIVETYVDDLLRALIAGSGIDDTAFGGALLAEMRDSFHNSWKNRYGWLDRGFGISMAGSKEQQDFDVVVELRNALAHGDGSLTARQKANLLSMLTLESRLETTLHVHARGGGLRLTSDSASAALLICRRFVLCLDRAACLACPGLDY